MHAHLNGFIHHLVQHQRANAHALVAIIERMANALLALLIIIALVIIQSKIAHLDTIHVGHAVQ